QGVTDAELAKAKAQLRARLVFDSDSVTNIAHQLGYFETIASVEVFASTPAGIARVTADEVAAAAARTLTASNRTIGWVGPIASQDPRTPGSTTSLKSLRSLHRSG